MECRQEVVSLAYVKWVKVLFWYPMAAILDWFFYLQLQSNSIKWIAETKYN